MDTSTFAVEAEVEASHWWFVVRLLKELGFFSRVGLDQSDEAIRWCAEKGLGRVTKGDLVERIPGGGLVWRDTLDFNHLLFVPIWVVRQFICLNRDLIMQTLLDGLTT